MIWLKNVAFIGSVESLSLLSIYSNSSHVG